MVEGWCLADVLFLAFLVVAIGGAVAAAVAMFFLTDQLWFGKEWHGDDFRA